MTTKIKIIDGEDERIFVTTGNISDDDIVPFIERRGYVVDYVDYEIIGL